MECYQGSFICSTVRIGMISIPLGHSEQISPLMEENLEVTMLLSLAYNAHPKKMACIIAITRIF